MKLTVTGKGSVVSTEALETYWPECVSSLQSGQFAGSRLIG